MDGRLQGSSKTGCMGSRLAGCLSVMMLVVQLAVYGGEASGEEVLCRCMCSKSWMVVDGTGDDAMSVWSVEVIEPGECLA